MSAMTTGRPGRLTRAAAPARRQAGPADRSQVGPRPRRVRRPDGQPGASPARHLHAVPDVAQVPGIQAVPAGRGGAGGRGAPAVPGPRRSAESGRPGETGRAGMRQAVRARDTRLAPPRPAVRLTRRGRIVVTILVTAACLLLTVLAWMAVAARAQAADSGLPPGAVYRNLTSVVVRPGQTLWSIASQAEPTADPRAVMQQIIDLNALSGTSVEPGQRLLVPRG